MPLTRHFKETIRARTQSDPDFRKAMLAEGIDRLLAGDLGVGMSVLRDYINATIGFAGLSELTGKSPKSLMRMLGPNGNPQAQNLVELIGVLQKQEQLQFRVQVNDDQDADEAPIAPQAGPGF